MTREEQIDIYSELDRYVEENMGDVSQTDIAKHFFELGQKDAIDKACEFLKNANAAEAIVIRKGVYNMKEFSVIEFTDNFIEQFKKAMQ